MINISFKKYIVIFFGVIFLTALSGCEGIIDVEPVLSVSDETALNTGEGINSVLISAYDGLQRGDLYNRDMIAFPEALADNLETTDASGRLVGEARNTIGSQFVSWNECYENINISNLIITRINSGPVDGLTEDEANQVLGEALFLRAHNYFDLMRAYAYDPTNLQPELNRGGVPLVLNGVIALGDVEIVGRAPVGEVYAQIVADLEMAASLLDNSNLPIRASRFGALGLLSRVQLYNGNYQEVINAANAVIGQGVDLLSNDEYVAGFTNADTNPEALFEISYQDDEGTGVNESLASSFRSDPGFGDGIPTMDLLSNYETADVRLGTYVMNANGRLECNKYNGHNGIANVDNVTILRLSELYLNRAEAFARINDNANAISDLNVIKTRAGVTTVTGLTGDALIDEILVERRIELAFEGHRFFDLKRLGLTIPKPLLPVDLDPTDFRVLAPIPGIEISTLGLEQNIGY